MNRCPIDMILGAIGMLGSFCACVKTALYNVLTMFKITTPETM